MDCMVVNRSLGKYSVATDLAFYNNCSFYRCFSVTNVPHVPNSPDSQTINMLPSDYFVTGMTAAYALIFVVALFGNSFGLLVAVKSSATNVTNLFIANMAVADLLLTVTAMPFSVGFFYRELRWFSGTLGTVTCKALFYVIPVSIAATVLTMLVISIDRFYAVFYPLKDKLFRQPRVFSTIVWILSVALMIPYVLIFQVQFDPVLNAHVCLQAWPWGGPNDKTETYRVLKIFHICVFVILYVIPLSIMAVVYFLICRKLWHRIIPGHVTHNNRVAAEISKRKVVRQLVILVVVFALCWFPTYVNHYFWFVQPEHYHKLRAEVYYVFTWLAHANSAINPCLYVILSGSFRRELASVLSCCPCLRCCSCLSNCQNRRRTTVVRITAPQAGPSGL